ncbi:uncharacterized protein LOC103713954 [Phoenix dactylifera]|uniref:Uncharacterized protein LOC103713954 n=1 Tax=Phoenix dactylifera TaxID=42345 RepID=A0A8B7CHC6_PHODC|nr:uncharacterized protein LOC103713954 [Phoenix dactylifera]
MEMMNRCGGKKSGFAAWEDMRGVAERNEPVVCPKPRRLTQLAAGVDPLRPLRWHAGTQVEPLCDSKAGMELLDIFLTKGGEASPVASPPPFFCGSPPSRASNPLVHDARFGEEKPAGPSLLPHAVIPSGSPAAPATSASRKGCGPTKFGLKPAAMRIEGFDCLDRDRRGCGITAIA